MYKFFSIAFLVILMLPAIVVGQSLADAVFGPQMIPKTPDRSLTFNLNESGSHYFKATFLNQFWVRYNQSNPGTTVMGESRDEALDFGLRRTRIQMYGQITDHVFVYFQFGQNNFNYLTNSSGNRKLNAFFHDALCEYKVTKNNALKIGGGLTIANGLSRFSQPSIGTIMTTDVPVFAQATVDQTDEFSRKLSVYARGQIWKLDYRFALSDPFPITSNGGTPPALGLNSNFKTMGHSKQVQGYLAYQFFEHEPHTTPYMTGTYLGSKKVFNIGAGAIYHPEAMWHLNSNSDTINSDMILFSAESFLDMPLNKEKGTAISAYAGYFNYNFGPEYLRFNGIMNPANGINAANSISGAGAAYGNAFPMMGTGSVMYAQVGYLLPSNLIGKCGQLMPYASIMHADYDRLEGNSMDVFNAGINWIIAGQKAKISLDYQNRPTFNLDASGDVQSGKRRSCFVMQYQVYL